MKIQPISDLHLEFDGADYTPANAGADILVIAGDLCSTRAHPVARDFLTRCSDEFAAVVYVAGNHEYYHGDIERVDDTLREMVSGLSNVHFLQNETVTIAGQRFFGATLWTSCNKGDPLTERTLADGMNDYRLVSRKSVQHWRMRPSDTRALHYETVDRLRAVLSDGVPTVVVTHHAPSRRATPPRYQRDYHMNGGYSSDLDLMIPSALAWFHGHTHDSFRYEVDGTTVVCNPRGYWQGAGCENRSFDPDLVVDVG